MQRLLSRADALRQISARDGMSIFMKRSSSIRKPFLRRVSGMESVPNAFPAIQESERDDEALHDLSHVIERQCSGCFPVDVIKPIISRRLCGKYHVSGSFHDDRISCESYDCPAQKLGRFGSTQIKPCSRLHHFFGPYKSGLNNPSFWNPESGIMWRRILCPELTAGRSTN